MRLTATPASMTGESRAAISCTMFFLITVNLLMSAASLQGAQMDEQVSIVRQHYSTINSKLSSYRKVKKNRVEIDSESGGSMDAYFEGKEIRKIVFLLRSESSRWNMEYYYWDGNLIFAYEKKIQTNMETMKTEYTQERRFYFKDGKLIKLLIDKNDVSPDDANYKDDIDSTVKLSKDLVAAAQASK